MSNANADGRGHRKKQKKRQRKTGTKGVNEMIKLRPDGPGYWWWKNSSWEPHALTSYERSGIFAREWEEREHDE